MWPLFELLSGCLDYMKDTFSHSPTKDMSVEMLNMFGDLMKVGKHMGWGLFSNTGYGMGTVLYYRVWAGDCSLIQGMGWGLFSNTGYGLGTVL